VGSTAGYNPYPYDHDHAPWNCFKDDPASTQLPFQGYWPTDYTKLPAVSIVSPNLLNDMHDGTITQGDTWLQKNIDSYAQWAKANNSLLIVTWDEDDGSQNNQVATIFVGQMVVPGRYNEKIDHFSILRTIEDMYGLTYAGASATAISISDIWSTTGTPPATPSSLTATAASSSEIDLAWSESSTNVTQFKIERSTDNVNFTQITTITASVTAYKDIGLTASTTY